MAESTKSLDISITSLKEYVFDLKTESMRLKRATEIVTQPVIITEKIDGTKLTLVRTNNADLSDYTKNWIVAYKGALLSPKEFGYMGKASKDDLTKKSIGISQYSLVFDHLEKINSKIVSIPVLTEFSVEFAQNKDTLTRDYAKKGGMFLRSFATVKYRIVSGDLLTVRTGEEVVDYDGVRQMAELIEISPFPLIHRGTLTKDSLLKNKILGPKMQRTNWDNPVDVLKDLSTALLSLPSALSDASKGELSVAEGVVLQLPNKKFFKVVQADQYDKAKRQEKKDIYKLAPEVATAYFQQIRSLVSNIFDTIGIEGKSEEDVISDTNFYIAKNERSLSRFFDALQKLVGEKKNMTNIRDDVHDTVRLMISKERLVGKTTKSTALIPIAGKPLHIGHWKLIEKAAEDNDNVIVYTSASDRKRKGEFPIFGSDLITIWTDIFIPALPRNVKVKFVDTPRGSAVHELAWFEQQYTQDNIDVPNINLYSDIEDIDKNFKDEDLQKYPALMRAGKINKIGVERTSTVNISGTEMREFLKNNDKESFMEFLPPVDDGKKEEIWNTLIARKPEDMKESNPYISLAHEVIDKVADKLLSEGGWRNPDTQEWEVTPRIVEKIVGEMDRFLDEFNAWSGLPKLLTKGPSGSGKYYKQDLDNPDIVYGDVDMQMVLPVESNDRKDQLESDKLFGEKIREFIATKNPSYIHDGSADPDFGVGYLIFNIDGKKIQVDLILSYIISADWTSTRTTPQRGLKGFVTGMTLSALSEVLNVVLGSSTNPYVNTLDGRVVSAGVKKNAVQKFFNPNELFADIVRFYANMAGIQNPDVSALRGHMNLDANDPSLKKKLETVVALANAFEDNGIFSAGVIISKDNETIRSRKQFVDKFLKTYVHMMERAKTAKKLEKAQTPSAMRTIDKIKRDADIGIDTAKAIVKENLILESGQSIAAVTPKIEKTFDGKPAQAITKLRIIDSQGNDLRNSVSTDVKQLVKALNDAVGFWTWSKVRTNSLGDPIKDENGNPVEEMNPAIEKGFIFNGSSQYLMSGDEKYKDLAKYKSSFGDIDVIVPIDKLDELNTYLDENFDEELENFNAGKLQNVESVEWKPTSKNKIPNTKFHFVGRPKSNSSLGGQSVTLFYYVPMRQIVQIDFEGDKMVTDPKTKFQAPSEWIKFMKDSPYEDLQAKIKGLAGAILLRNLIKAATALPNSVGVTADKAEKIKSLNMTELPPNFVSKNPSISNPSEWILNTSGSGFQGIRKAFPLVKKGMKYKGRDVDVYTRIDWRQNKEDELVAGVDPLFRIIFKRAPKGNELKKLRSYVNLLDMMRELPTNVIKKTLTTMKEDFDDMVNSGFTEEEYNPIRQKAIEILGGQDILGDEADMGPLKVD